MLGSARRRFWSLVVDALAWRWCGSRAWLWAICRLSDATDYGDEVPPEGKDPWDD